MATFGRWLLALVCASVFAGSAALAQDRGEAQGAVYDITHFDVLPVTTPFDSEQIAYAALFAYRDASISDPGALSFRIVNWLEATNHSFIVDVWKNQAAFEAHLAQPHSVAFRFAVQDLPPPDSECCIGSPIDDRQYSLTASFGTPWVSNQLPTTVGTAGALFVIIYVDFLVDGDPFKGQKELVSYGAVSAAANPGRLLNFSLLQQLDRPNRYVMLEVWDNATDYDNWSSGAQTANLPTQLKPLLGSPLDTRLNSLCGEDYVDGMGCTP
jgi:quinol monooxygenase YgiN